MILGPLSDTHLTTFVLRIAFCIASPVNTPIDINQGIYIHAYSAPIHNHTQKIFIYRNYIKIEEAGGREIFKTVQVVDLIFPSTVALRGVEPACNDFRSNDS